jgi:hypothetical protein
MGTTPTAICCIDLPRKAVTHSAIRPFQPRSSLTHQILALGASCSPSAGNYIGERAFQGWDNTHEKQTRRRVARAAATNSRRGVGIRLVRRRIAQPIHGRPGRLRFHRPGEAARPVGLGGLSAGARHGTGRRGRLPGDLPRVVLPSRLDPEGRSGRKLALWNGPSGCHERQAWRDPAPDTRAAGGDCATARADFGDGMAGDSGGPRRGGRAAPVPS